MIGKVAVDISMSLDGFVKEGGTTFTFVTNGVESALDGLGDVALERTRVVEAPTGVTHLRFRVVKYVLLALTTAVLAAAALWSSRASIQPLVLTLG